MAQDYHLLAEDPPEVVMRKRLRCEASWARGSGLADNLVKQKLRNLCLLEEHRLRKRQAKQHIVIIVSFIGVLSGIIGALYAPGFYAMIFGLISLGSSFAIAISIAENISIEKQSMELKCFSDEEGLALED